MKPKPCLSALPFAIFVFLSLVALTSCGRSPVRADRRPPQMVKAVSINAPGPSRTTPAASKATPQAASQKREPVVVVPDVPLSEALELLREAIGAVQQEALVRAKGGQR